MRALSVAVFALCGLAATACAGQAASGETVISAPTPAAAPASGSDSAPASVQVKDAAVAPLKGKVVAVDPGHNGGNYKDPKAINKQVDVLTKRKACDTTGTATNDGYSEAAFTWDVSQRLAKILKRRGAKVVMTRSNNASVGPCITERAAIGNKAKADAAISVHADGAAAGNHGFHVIMPKKINGPVDPVVGASRKLGVAVRDSFTKTTGQPYSTYIGSKALNFRDDLGGLNLSTVPKIFIECGNMRNAAEAAKFRDPAFRQKVALGLANGIQTYLK